MVEIDRISAFNFRAQEVFVRPKMELSNNKGYARRHTWNTARNQGGSRWLEVKYSSNAGLQWAVVL